MNVCVAAQHSITMVAGGPRTQVLQTARYLPDYGVNVSFFNQWEEFRPKEYDLAHVFGANLMTYDLAQRFHHFGMPFVVSSIFFTQRNLAYVRLVLRMERLAQKVVSGMRTDYGFTAHVCGLGKLVLPNTTQEGMLLEQGLGIDRNRIQVVPNGVEERFRYADPALFRTTYGLNDFVLNVGHIGSLRKNVLSLIRALKNIDVPAVIIGKVHQSDYARQCLAEAAANKNILIIEGLENDSEMLASAYAACNVFALPSYFETPGIAALEAGLAGAKVVITNCGGTEDYFGDQATYVHPNSVASIQQGIEAALAVPKGNRLQERIMKEFTWQKVAEKTAQAYRSALA